MDIKTLQESSNELKIEIKGVRHAFCNLLHKKLLEDKNVEIAGYDIPHPLVSNPVLYIRTKDKVKPRDSLFSAVEKIIKNNQVFTEAFKKSMKKS